MKGFKFRFLTSLSSFPEFYRRTPFPSPISVSRFPLPRVPVAGVRDNAPSRPVFHGSFTVAELLMLVLCRLGWWAYGDAQLSKSDLRG
jgi:hypothetical protein